MTRTVEAELEQFTRGDSQAFETLFREYLWGLWNMLYIVVRGHWRIPLGVHGALVPLLVGPLALGNAFLLGFDIPRFALAMFPAGVAVAMLAYYLVWKYLVGFLNRMLQIG